MTNKCNRILTISAGVLAASLATPLMAEDSCMDLWYQRNLIYAQNGYCFSTPLGQREFAGFKCWTNNPRLTPQEQRRVDAIRAEERQRGCKVN